MASAPTSVGRRQKSFIKDLLIPEQIYYVIHAGKSRIEMVSKYCGFLTFPLLLVPARVRTVYPNRISGQRYCSAAFSETNKRYNGRVGRGTAQLHIKWDETRIRRKVHFLLLLPCCVGCFHRKSGSINKSQGKSFSPSASHTVCTTWLD